MKFKEDDTKDKKLLRQHYQNNREKKQERYLGQLHMRGLD